MRIPERLGRWLAPLALMALIYALSAQPHLDSGLGVLDLVARKLVHMAEFGLLAFLWWRPLRDHLRPTPALATSFALAVAYAATDEYHQTFVASRNGSLTDLLIDAAGAAFAVALIAWRTRARADADGGDAGDGDARATPTA